MNLNFQTLQLVLQDRQRCLEGSVYLLLSNSSKVRW